MLERSTPVLKHAIWAESYRIVQLSPAPVQPGRQQGQALPGS